MAIQVRSDTTMRDHYSTGTPQHHLQRVRICRAILSSTSCRISNRLFEERLGHCKSRAKVQDSTGERQGVGIIFLVVTSGGHALGGTSLVSLR